MDYKDFVTISFKNKKLLESSELCGCYYCCRTFQFSDIKEWTDKGETAICPHCRIDSVVSAKLNEHEDFIEALKKAEKEFF